MFSWDSRFRPNAYTLKNKTKTATLWDERNSPVFVVLLPNSRAAVDLYVLHARSVANAPTAK